MEDDGSGGSPPDVGAARKVGAEGRIGTAGKAALLVIDVQQAAVTPELWQADAVLRNIARLLDGSRASGTEVIFVQDQGPPGSPYEPGTEGWHFHPAVEPRSTERVVRKRFSSAFRDTDLRTCLDAEGIDTLVMVGLHTEYCFDTTCRVAFEFGYRVVIPEMTNTTFDGGALSARQIYEHHNHHVFRDRFATVTSMDTALAILARRGPDSRADERHSVDGRQSAPPEIP